LSGSAGFFTFGAHSFHLDFILAQYGILKKNTEKLPFGAWRYFRNEA
jgi:hypothetical protein